jgi:uncharacterized membrane protein
MMSQNRQATKDRLKADLDYEVNLKAELEDDLEMLKAELADILEELEEIKSRKGNRRSRPIDPFDLIFGR